LGDPRAERQLVAGFGDVLMGTLRPQDGLGEPITANSIQVALHQLEETALNLHIEPHPPRWLFRAEVNIVAQINRRARSIAREAAQELLVKTLRKLVGGTVYVFPFHHHKGSAAALTDGGES